MTDTAVTEVAYSLASLTGGAGDGDGGRPFAGRRGADAFEPG